MSLYAYVFFGMASGLIIAQLCIISRILLDILNKVNKK